MEQLSEKITLFAEPVFHFGNFAVTNALFTSWIVVAIIIILSLVLRSKLTTIPGKLQNIAEIILEGDRCESLIFVSNFHILFGFNRLMEAIAPATTWHQATREFINDDNFAIFDHVIHI